MKTRYQVLVEGQSKVENFQTKAEAQKRAKELVAKGLKAKVWDCQNNNLSRLFRF